MTEFRDEIDRAMERNGVLPGSALERDTRQNLWTICGADWTETRDQKIDKFVREQKANPYYSDSLVRPKPREKKPEPQIDPLNLTPAQFEEIATGKVRLG